MNIYKKIFGKKTRTEEVDFLEGLLEAITSPVFAKDIHGRYNWCNTAFARFLKLPKEKIIGKTVFEISPSELSKIYHEKDMELFKSGGKQIYESIVKNHEGSNRNVAFHKSVYRNKDNEPLGLIGIIWDITDKKRAEKIEAKNSQRIQSLLNIIQQKTDSIKSWFNYALNEAVKLTDSRMGYIYSYDEEKQELRLDTWSGEAMNEGPILNSKNRYSLDTVKLWSEVVKNKKPVIINNFEPSNVFYKDYPEDHAKAFKLLAIPILEENKIVAIVTVANKEIDYDDQDVVQLSLLTGSIFRTAKQRENERIIKENEAERKKIWEKMIYADKLSSVGTLAAGVAHEINNPLAIILGHITVLEAHLSDRGNLGELELKSLATQKSAIARCVTIIKNLQTYATSKSDEITIVDFHKIITESLSLCEMAYSKTGITISLDLKSDKSRIKGNSGKFQQVVMNLLSNAKDALENISNASITIETFNQDNKFICIFSDNGIGMDEYILDQIFVPFFTTKPVGQAVGLGLSYAYSIITSVGGDITVESLKGTGSRFVISLPVA